MGRGEISTAQLAEQTGCPRGSIFYFAAKAGVRPTREAKVSGKTTAFWKLSAVAEILRVRPRRETTQPA